MIKLTGINKIYRTNEIETLALENVNLDVIKGEFVSVREKSDPTDQSGSSRSQKTAFSCSITWKYPRMADRRR